MKKTTILFVLALALVLVGCSSGSKTTKMGYAVGAAHGTRSFTIVSVAMDGDKISSAVIDELQFVANDGSFVAVPNSDSDFGAGGYAEGQVLISKRTNNEAYSALMKANGGATQTLLASWNAIEDFVKGKTVAEITSVDTVASCTLADAKGYLGVIAEAAKNAK